MKRALLILGLAVLGVGLILPGYSDSEVEPSTIVFTNARDESITSPTTVQYYESASLRLTNCVCWNDNTGDVQTLDGVTVTITVGNANSNVTDTATVTSTNLGTFSLDLTIPDVDGTCYIQTKITDANTNIYTYPWKILNTKEEL